MSKNAPDTRNRLESIKVSTPKRKKIKKAEPIKSLQRVEVVVKAPEVSNGQVFKEKFGYSKSMKRAMRKAGLDINNFSDSLAAYRDVRKKRKSAARKVKKDKHMRALSGRKGKAAVAVKGQKKAA